MFEVISMDNEKKRRIVIIAAVIPGILGLVYLGGMIGQFMDHYKTWLGAGGIGGNTEMNPSISVRLRASHRHLP